MNYSKLCYLALWLATAATAQVNEPMLNYPLAPVTEGPGSLVEPPLPSPVTDPQRSAVLLPALRGLRLVSHPDALLADSSLPASLDLSGIDPPAPDALRVSLQPLLGRPLSLALLDEISTIIVSHYRDRDFPVVDAVAPQGQDISEGVVQMVVVVGRLGQLSVAGNRHFSEAQMRAQVSVTPGTLLRRSQLETDLERLNRNPFRRVNLQLQEGAAFGETDVLLQVEDQRPWRIYGGGANTGNRLTGEDQYFVGANWGNAFGRDHQLGYQFTGTSRGSDFRSHTLSYEVPMTGGRALSLFAAHVTSDPPPDSRGFDLQGRNWQVGLRHRLPLSRGTSVQHQLDWGADFKRSNNDLQFGTLRVFNTFTDIVQFTATYSASRADAGGRSGLGLALVYSPGGLSRDNEDAAFSASRQGATADYAYVDVSLERIQRLPLGLTFRAELQAQFSPDTLLGSEQFGIGGFRSVRGYDEFLNVGDRGGFIRTEVRSATWQPGGEAVAAGDLQLLWFLDYGAVRSSRPLPGEQQVTLGSTGPGARWSLDTRASLRLDYGYQLREATAGAGQTWQLHLGLNIAF